MQISVHSDLQPKCHSSRDGQCRLFRLLWTIWKVFCQQLCQLVYASHSQTTEALAAEECETVSRLQDSLGGNAKTVIIANVSPGAACLRESQSTLAFAQRAQQIVNKAVVNEATHGELAALTKENRRLHRELRLLNDTCRLLQQVGTAR